MLNESTIRFSPQDNLMRSTKVASDALRKDNLIRSTKVASDALCKDNLIRSTKKTSISWCGKPTKSMFFVKIYCKFRDNHLNMCRKHSELNFVFKWVWSTSKKNGKPRVNDFNVEKKRQYRDTGAQARCPPRGGIPRQNKTPVLYMNVFVLMKNQF